MPIYCSILERGVASEEPFNFFSKGQQALSRCHSKWWVYHLCSWWWLWFFRPSQASALKACQGWWVQVLLILLASRRLIARFQLRHIRGSSYTANPTWGVIFESSKLKARTSLLPRFSEKRLLSFELWALKQHSKMSPQVGLAVHPSAEGLCPCGSGTFLISYTSLSIREVISLLMASIYSILWWVRITSAIVFGFLSNAISLAACVLIAGSSLARVL